MDGNLLQSAGEFNFIQFMGYSDGQSRSWWTEAPY
jgi:hypothetical protein